MNAHIVTKQICVAALVNCSMQKLSSTLSNSACYARLVAAVLSNIIKFIYSINRLYLLILSANIYV